MSITRPRALHRASLNRALAGLPSLAGRVMLAIVLSLALVVAVSPRRASADAAPPPYGMIVLLQMRTPTSQLTCTGFMIGPHTVATAGHCLYNKDFGGWATSAFVTPGIDGLNAPYGTEVSATFAVAPGWVERQELTSDYGTITLATDDLGKATGWFEVAPPNDFQLARGVYSTAGYGTAVPPTTVWKMARPAALAEWDDDFLAYVWGTSTGVSGAPIFEPGSNGSYRVLGIVKGAFGARNDRLEFGVRINGGVASFFAQQTAQPLATPVPQTVPTMFATTAGTPIRVTSPATRANTETVLQSSADRVNWATLASATTDTRGLAIYTVTPTETRYYRVVVLGLGTGRIGQGTVSTPGSGDAGSSAAGPAAASATGTSATIGFVAPPVFSSSRVALVVFRGSPTDFVTALRTARATAAWVQDAQGQWRLYILGGTFVNEEFQRAFPNGFPAATPMTLVAA